MKAMRLLVCAIVNLLVLNVSISPLFAKTPTTPKILFTSVPDGNYEVFIMNPDGSEQVNLTQHLANDLASRLVSQGRSDSFRLRSRRWH